MPPLVVASIIGAGAGLAGAGLSAHANSNAADITSKAATDAAALQKQTADSTLAFEKDQAAQSRADNIAAQTANFGQWGYRQNSIRPYQGSGLAANNTLAQLLGLPPQNTQLPDLPPPPSFATNGGAPSGSSSGGSSSGGPAATGVDGSAGSISAYFKKAGVSDQETPYWVSKWPELVARGKEIGDPNYAANRLAAADVFGKQPAASPQNIGGYAGLPPVAPTPAGTGSTLPFIPLSIGSYAVNG